jgi:hypothetical protein
MKVKVKAWNDESGQMIALLAVCIVVLLGFVALAADVGVMFHEKRMAQSAADAAAIAGAEQIQFGDVIPAAQTDAARNGFTDGVDGATVAVYNPPNDGPNVGKSAYVEVIVSKLQPTYFMRLFGVNSMTLSARAVAALEPSNICQLGNEGIKYAGSADIQSPGCTAQSNGDFQIAGSATVNMAGEYSVGPYTTDGNPVIAVPPSSDALPVPDPLAYLQPPSYSGCQSAANSNPLSPGCYNNLTITGPVSLNPGLYIINGNLNLTGQGSLTGTGVTFYITPKGSISVTGQATMNLSAPTSGTYDGILFYQDPSNTTSANFTGGDGTILQGILYFPNALVNWVGGSTLSQTPSDPLAMSIIAGQIEFSGNSTIENYSELNPTSPLLSPRIVE